MIIDFLSIGFENLVLLGHYSYKEAREKLQIHRHTDMVEICYLETGYQNYQIGGKQFFLKGGDVLVTPPNVLHGTSGFPEEKGSLFWMILKVPKDSYKLLNLSETESRLIIENIITLPSLHFRGSSKLKSALAQIFTIYNGKSNVYQKIEIKNQVLIFLLEIIKCGEKLGAKQLVPDIDYVCNYIGENISQKFRIHELAKMVNLSESRFKHKFKSEAGIPPNEYILKKKIEFAKKQIHNQELSLADLAYDLGFSSPSYFSTVFRKYVGVPPSAYKVSG